MSCDACRAAQEAGDVAFYRVDEANVMMSGCRHHLRKAMDMLRTAQEQERQTIKAEFPWKHDEMKEIQYVVVGPHVVLARSVTIKNFGESVVLGEIFVDFLGERTFSDGSVCLSEDGTVSGGISIKEAKNLIEELKQAVKLVETGEVK